MNYSKELDKILLWLRYAVVIIVLFCAAYCSAAIFWPPDMVPHPPHYPRPHPDEPMQGNR